MSECNHDYSASFKQINQINNTSWWSLFSIIKRSTKMIPEMFDPELLLDVAEFERIQFDKETLQDLNIATQLNYLEYEECGQLITCSCCFNDVGKL